MDISTALRDLCAKHDLTAISINYNAHCIHAYVHWGVATCASGYGGTAEEALADAIRQANSLRGQSVAVPAIEIGEVAA